MKIPNYGITLYLFNEDCKLWYNYVSQFLLGSVLHCMRYQQVRFTRLRLEAHAEGNAGMLLQGIDADGTQARYTRKDRRHCP